MNLKEDDYRELQHYEDEYSLRLARIEKLAHLLDSRFTIPGTQIPIGWDGLIGLIPGVGDTITLLPQLYLLYEAFRTKVSAWTIMRMLVNIGIDWLVGNIPLVGDLFDIAFKSNLRNAKLVAESIREKQARTVE